MAVTAMWISTGWTLIGGMLAWIIDLPTAHLMGRRGSDIARRRAVVAVLATSALFGLATWRSEHPIDTLAVSCLALFGVRLAMIDLASQLLPRALVLPLYPALLALFGLGAVVDDRHVDLLRATVGMIVLPAAYLAVALLSRGGVGAGDIRLAGPVGLVLAWHSWAMVVTGTVLAFVYASVTALALAVAGRAIRHTGVPFGPGMLCGALTAVLLQLG